jgi:NodT family efflux transporter outer membrane factor (OMF) lipoprotein
MDQAMTKLRWHAATAAVAALMLTGCRVGPKYQKPPALAQAPPAAYKESPANFPGPETAPDTWKVAQPDDAMLRGKWWEIYNDPELNALEEKLNIDNQTLKQYFENFMESRALIAEARSQLFPTVTFGPSYEHTATSANVTNTANTAGTTTGTGTTTTTTTTGGTNRSSGLIALPFDVSWEPDLWGKVRNTIRENQYNAQVSAAELENERLTEQASLAVYYFEIRGQDALQDVYNKTVAADQKALDLTRSQYETGVTQEISVVEAQNTLQNAQAASTNVAIARAQYEHAIATLIGTGASSFSIPVRPLNAVPPEVPIGVPSQLLERRPDIAAAERTMASANAAIGVADAAYYPTLTLGAAAGVESSTLQSLFNWSSRYWSVGPGISETIYEGGLRRATVRQYTAIYNADVANYRETVLTAFQQVEDYLAEVRILSRQIQQQQQAAQSAQRFVDLETARYETGVDPYINVLTAQTTLLNDQQTLANLHTQEMSASVELIVALGGGWDSTQLPTPAAVSKKLTAAETTIQR